MRLSKRLQALADLIPSGSSIADIASEHALLPIYLLKNHIIEYAVVGELYNKPFHRARQAVNNAGLSKQIVVRQGDGLEVLNPYEVDLVVIAGLGGENIVNILNRESNKSQTFAYYVLQPMNREAEVRRFCAKQGWQLKQETLVYEKKRYFTILKLQTGFASYEISPLQAEIGFNLNLSEKLHKNFLQHKKDKFVAVLNSIQNKKTPHHNIQYFQHMVSELERILGHD